jgi:hypothetical protein
MPYYESELDYDSACFLKEQRDYQRYYNTPLEVEGVWFASLADYETYIRLKEAEEARLEKMTIDLKMIIKQMARDEKIEQMFDSLKEFPTLQ